MKFLKLCLIAFLFFVSLGSATAETLKWCAYFNWSPWIYSVGDKYDGILIEQLELFKKDNNVKAEVVVIKNWKRCQAELKDSRVDMILGANKTEDRLKIFNYVTEPSFLNKSMISAYALKSNTKVPNVNNLEELKKYKLHMSRGNSFGQKIDNFVKSLGSDVIISNHQEEMLQTFVRRQKGDYFLSASSSMVPLLKKYEDKIPGLKKELFKEIFTTERAVPVHIVFSKKGTKYSKYNDLWVKTIKKYNSMVDINERIEYHKSKSK